MGKNAWAAVALAAALAPGALAQEEGASPISFNLSVVSDYRFRGFSPSDKDPALQGGADVDLGRGFAAGVWATSIADLNGANAEVDLYGSKSFALGEAELAFGAIGYFYPGGSNVNYGEVFVNLSRTLAGADVGAGLNYGWEQANLGDDDNLYAYANAVVPLGRLGQAPLAFNASLGAETGAFDFGEDKLDWSLGLALNVGRVDLSLSYVDTNLDLERADATVIGAIAATF